MQKLLLISISPALESRLGDLLDSPRHIARVSSWPEAHRLLTKTSPAAVVVGSRLAVPSKATELVRLNDVLSKDGKQAYLLSEQTNGELSQWTDMFNTVEEILPLPSTSDDWTNLVRLLQPHLASEPASEDKPPKKQLSKPLQIVIRLPKIRQGTLAKLPLSRVIYCLHCRDATGTLLLSSGNIERRFAFHNGRFVLAPDHNDAEALCSAYAWTDGAFSFQSRHSVSGSPTSIYEIMSDGLTTYRPQREIMSGLMSRMKTYPVTTQFCRQRREANDWDSLQRFLDLCDGERTLEAIFSDMSNRVTEAFACAVFARDTDLVVFRADPTQRKVTIEYDHQSTATTSRESSSSPSKIERATGKDRKGLEEELTQRLHAMESMSIHDIFGVWEGCGREVVKETYYSMIKEHHPDSYGGNVSGEVARLAQRIFIQIRKAYAELMKTEREQTVSPPDEKNTSFSTQKGRREQVSTLKFSVPSSELVEDSAPVASEPTKQRTSRRKHHTSPIAMAREPTSTHPSLDSQSEEATTDEGPKKSSPSRSKRSFSRKKSKPPARSASDVFDTPARGLGDHTTDPEVRRQKLKRLKKRRRSSAGRRHTSSAGGTPSKKSSKSGQSGSDNRAQQSFNMGYKKFKKGRYREALPLLKKAHQGDSENALYTTLYAYCLFQVDSDRSRECIKLLRTAIKANHRQSLPDAHLFLGNILKANDNEHRAYKHFKKSLDLNPTCRDAEREIRLYESRHGKSKKKKKKSDDSGSGGFFKKLFKD